MLPKLQALDAAGNTVGAKVPFAKSDWLKTEYTIGGGQVASGIVITSDLPIYGIEFGAEGAPIEAYMKRVFARRSFQQSLTELEQEMRI